MKEIWSNEAETALLGALLNQTERTYERSKPLAAKHFYDYRHAKVFAAIESMLARKIPVDPITVFDAVGEIDLPGGTLDYLMGLSHLSATAHAASRYAGILRERASHRALLEASDLTSEIISGEATMAEKIDKITSLYLALQREGVSKVPQTLAEVALLRTQHYEDLQEGRTIAGWQTHFPTIDRALNGGLRPGGVYIVAARPSVGKSSLSQFIGHGQARDGRPVLFLSQEMANEELADRGVASAGRIDYSNLLSGTLSTDDWMRASEALQAEDLANFYVDDQGSLTLADIRAKAKLVPGLKVLIVDYLQLCAGDGQNRNSEIEEISRGLKALAKELKIAVIALSQLSRKVDERASKRPILSDLRDSGSIEQDADVVFMLWTVKDLESGARVVGCSIEKNRQGNKPSFALHFDGALQRWGESTESIDMPAPAKTYSKGFQG